MPQPHVPYRGMKRKKNREQGIKDQGNRKKPPFVYAPAAEKPG